MATIRPNIAQYPNGFTDGVTVRDVPILNTYSGRLWWVDATGAQTGDGKFNRPFALIDDAINHAAAGDTILVKAGHTETVTAAAGIDADVAGISIIGLGQGRRRPTISFTTAATADIDIDAANITFSNLVFDLTGVASLAAPIDVNAADFTLQGCEFIQSDGTNQCERAVVGATAAARMRIIGNTFRSTTAGAVSAINLVGTADGTEIRGNDISGDYSTAAIENATGNVLTNLIIDDNYIRNDNAGDWAIELVSACTGVISRNRVATDAIATAVDWGSCAAFGNTYFDTSDTDKNGTEIPVAVTVGGVSLGDIATTAATGAVTTTDNAMAYIKQLVTQMGVEADTDPVSAVLSGTGGITTWKSAAAPATGVSVSEVLREIYDQQEKAVVKAAAVMVTGDTLFTIAGGPIAVSELVSVCATANDGTASTIQYTADPTDGAVTNLSIASASVASVAAGTTLLVTGTFGAAPTVSAEGTVAAGTSKFIVPAGVMKIVVAVGSTTGTWTHHLRYKPLARGVTVS